MEVRDGETAMYLEALQVCGYCIKYLVKPEDWSCCSPILIASVNIAKLSSRMGTRIEGSGTSIH